MEGVQHSLERLLTQHFHIVPARTNRHDQWYKRKYQSWKQDNEDREPLILTSKNSKDEWVPQLHASAALFARAIRQKADRRPTWTPPSDQKLFADDVLDQDLSILAPDPSEPPILTPAMQRASYWSTSYRANREAHYRAIKGLLATDQIDLLCHLARRDGTHFEYTASVRGPAPPGPFPRPNIGWAGIVAETLEVLIALVVLKSQAGALSLSTAYQAWVPFVFTDSRPYGSVAAARLESMFPGAKGESVGERGWDGAIAWCFRVLEASGSLLVACDAPSVEWEKCLIDMFLFFVGFESWNRSREGQGYLGCELNQGKDSAWLKKVTGLKPEVLEDDAGPKMRRKKSKDPLHLRDAKKEDEVELSQEELELQEELADVEAEEARYGQKRSTKYQKRRG